MQRVFVLKDLQPEAWLNNGSCYGVHVRGGGAALCVWGGGGGNC